MLGYSAIIKITSVGRWSIFGDVIEILSKSNDLKIPSDDKENCNTERCSPCSNQEDTCACSSEKPEPCACESDACKSNGCNAIPDSYPETQNDQNARNDSSLLQRRKPSLATVEKEDKSHQKLATHSVRDGGWGLLDTALLGGIFISLLTIVALVLYARS